MEKKEKSRISKIGSKAKEVGYWIGGTTALIAMAFGPTEANAQQASFEVTRGTDGYIATDFRFGTKLTEAFGSKIGVVVRNRNFSYDGENVLSLTKMNATIDPGATGYIDLLAQIEVSNAGVDNRVGAVVKTGGLMKRIKAYFLADHSINQAGSFQINGAVSGSVPIYSVRMQADGEGQKQEVLSLEGTLENLYHEKAGFDRVSIQGGVKLMNKVSVGLFADYLAKKGKDAVDLGPYISVNIPFK